MKKYLLITLVFTKISVFGQSILLTPSNQTIKTALSEPLTITRSDNS